MDSPKGPTVELRVPLTVAGTSCGLARFRRSYGMRIRVCLLMLGLLGMVARTHALEFAAAHPHAHDEAAKAGADFAHPLRDYSCRRLAGWSVLMEEEMTLQDPVLAAKAQAKIEAKLKEIRQILPSHTLARLQKVPIFFLYGEKSTHGGRPDGAEFFAQNAPDHNKSLDPRMGGAIVVYSAKHFCEMTEFGATKVLIHEMAHAWHLTQWVENKSDIVFAYQTAMDKTLYRNVRTAKGSTLPEAYAAVNHLEYFAELSCVWFCGSDHFPFDGGDLKLYDPSGYQLMKRLWSEDPNRSASIASR